MTLPENCTLGIVGTGLMGRGIAQIAAQAGIDTLLYDAVPDAATKAHDGIAGTLRGLAAKGKLSEEAVAAAAAVCIRWRRSKDLARCDIVVIEAIVESLPRSRSSSRRSKRS